MCSVLCLLEAMGSLIQRSANHCGVLSKTGTNVGPAVTATAGTRCPTDRPCLETWAEP